MKKKILIIGYGSIGKKHYQILKKYFQNKFEISILRTSLKSASNKINFFFNIQNALKFKPNYVIICSAANRHYYYYKKFKNIAEKFFIEKPLIDKLDINKLKIFNTVNNVYVGYFLHFNPIIEFLKKTIKKKISKILYVRIEVGYNLKYWRKGRKYWETVSAKKSTGGGVLNELSHELDLATNLFGLPVKVFSTLGKYSNLKINVEDLLECQLIYPKKIVSLNLNFLEDKLNRKIKIILNDQVIECSLANNSIVFIKKNKKIIKKFKFKNENIYKKQFEYFLSKDNFQDKRFSTLKSSIDIVKLINQLKVSNHQRKEVNAQSKI